MLTVLLAPRQVRFCALQTFGSMLKVVLELAMAVMLPRVSEWTVTLVPLTAVMTPVKSSTRSSAPVGVPVRGRVVAVSTLACVKSTETAPLVVVMALFRLKSSDRPVCWLGVRVSGNGAVESVIVPEAAGRNSHGVTALTGQAVVAPVSAPVVWLMRTMSGALNATVALV